jgi:hypothetical protein
LGGGRGVIFKNARWFAVSGLLYFTLFYFTLLYFILLYFTLFYFILLYFTLFYFTLLYFILLYFILLYFILLYFILLYFILLYFTLLYVSVLYCRYCTLLLATLFSLNLHVPFGMYAYIHVWLSIYVLYAYIMPEDVEITSCAFCFSEIVEA